MTIEIGPVPAKDTRRWFEAVMVAFGEDVNEEQWLLDQKIFEPDRVLAAWDADRIVGGGAAYSFQMTVPGGAKVPTAGVTMVGVMPTHRRQGALRGLMARQLADVRAAGEPLAALWASEGSIYQRFGYGLATLNGAIDIERERAAFRTPVATTGSVELRDAEAAKPSLARVYDVMRAATPGFYERSPVWWEVLLADPEYRRRGAGKRFNAVLTRNGEDVGYALYRIKSDWIETGPANTLVVVELIGVDADAVQQLWRYVFGVDLMSRIRSRLAPADHPLLLLVAEPRRLQLRVTDGMWLRIVDVAAALDARGYAEDGSIVLEVRDEFMPEVGGRWRLTARDGRGRTEKTDDPADLELDVQDLAAVYMGAFRFASLGRAGRLSAPRMRERVRTPSSPPPSHPGALKFSKERTRETNRTPEGAVRSGDRRRWQASGPIPVSWPLRDDQTLSAGDQPTQYRLSPNRRRHVAFIHALSRQESTTAPIICSHVSLHR